MNCTHRIISTVTFLFPQNPNFKTLISPKFARDYCNDNAPNPIAIHSLNEPSKCFLKLRGLKIGASANGNGDTGNWVGRFPTGALAADKILRLISGATACPIGQFISSPTTFLHSVDPRVKLVWLLALVVLPARSHIVMRFGLIVFIALLSVWILPKHVWMDQLGRVSLLSGILFIMLGLGSDGAPPLVQLRTPPPAMMGLPKLPVSLGGYSYLIMKLGPLQFTRKGMSVASTAASLTFIIFQSASLCLATTTPEQLAFALRWFMLPLRHIGVPVAEITLTLLLSLRFINLVFDEVRNVALGIVSRRIKWQQLTVMEKIDVFASYIRRIFKNIFSHAEQISQILRDWPCIRCRAWPGECYSVKTGENCRGHLKVTPSNMYSIQAMIVRGFRGDSKTHKIYFLSESSFGMADFVSLICLVGVVGSALLSDYFLV